MITDIEQAVIQKAIDEGELYKLLNVDIGKCFYLNQDIWGFVVDYNAKYKQIPTIEIIQKKYPEFESQDLSGISLDYLIDEAQNV